jgi:hypothetical protein
MRQSTSICFALALSALVAPQAHAASIDAGARVCPGSALNCEFQGPGEGGGGAVFTGASGVGAQVAFGTLPGNTPVIELWSGAAQDYGVFLGRVEVLVDAPYSSPGSFWSGSATGLVRDTWTINGGSGSGTLRVSFTVGGSIVGVPSAGTVQGDLRIAVVVAGGVAAGSTGPIVESGVYGFIEGNALPFVFGEPFLVEITSALTTSISAPNDGAAIFGLLDADFRAGAYLSSIEVYDDQGQPVPGFTLVSESGTAYPVPEPDTAAIGGIACAALAARSRRTWRSR